MIFAALVIAMQLTGQHVLELPGPKPERPHGFLALGVEPCSSWTHDRDMDSRSSQPNLARFMEIWLTGFINGAASKDAKLADADPRIVAQRLDDYCKVNPSHELLRAVAVVLKGLPKR